MTGYERLVEISRTDRAVVYRAYQRAFRRDVAIKVYLDKGSTFEENRRLLGALAGHRNVVAVHEFGVLDNGDHFVVMELLDALTPADADVVGEEFASLTEYAKRKGLPPIVLEPEHIWLSAFGGPRWTGRHVSTPLGSRAPVDELHSPALTPLPAAGGTRSEEPTVQVGLIRRRRPGRKMAVLAVAAGLCLAALGTTFSAETASPPRSTTTRGLRAVTTTTGTPTGLGAVLFRDALSEIGAFTASEALSSTTFFAGGRMHVAVQGTRGVTRAARWMPPAPFGRLSVSVDVRHETPAASGGPACIREDSAFYAGAVGDEGLWKITVNRGTVVEVASGRTSLPGDSVRVRLDCLADQVPVRLELWVNDQRVGSGTDASQRLLRGAGVGVGSSPTLEGEVSFADFEVRQIQ